MSSAAVALTPIHTHPPMVSSICCGNPNQESILIFLSLPGSVFPMRVLESDSIESVKLRIQYRQGFVVKDQKLVCSGRELSRSGSLVRDYGITDGNVLHLVLRLSDIRVIKVRTTSGKEFVFYAERGRDVGYVKRQLAKKEKEFDDVDEQEVVCDGERLEDQWLIDDVCKCRSDAVIHLLVRKSSKFRTRPVEKNFELSIEALVLSDEDKVRRQCDGGQDDDKSSRREYDVGSEKNGRKCYEVLSRKYLGRDFSLEPIVFNPEIKFASVIHDMVSSTFDGLNAGNDPIRSMEGTGGAYFMQDVTGQEFVSVFKPIDEEPMAVNNPRGLPLSTSGEGLKRGTAVGEGALREVAAYLLDHPKGGPRSLFGEEKGFAGVPPTTLIKCLHKGFNHPGDLTVKVGSLQMFMDNNGSCEDMGPGAFPVREVHKISVLDIRMANADRHAGNILISKDVESGQILLIPIDHGYCLPDTFEDCTFDWLYWPQSHQPYDSETIDYIKSLNAEEDIGLLKFHGWDIPVECARTLRISTMLLKKGVAMGLTPFEIGSIMCRETLKKESVIEEIVAEAMDSVLPGTSEAAFLEAVPIIMDRHLGKIAGSKCR